MKRTYLGSHTHAAHAPRNEEELKDCILDAVRAGRVLRIVGSAHSVPSSIANHGNVVVSLENIRRVVNYEADRGRISVEAGITLGPNPAWPNRPVDETLGGYLQKQATSSGVGWALPLLGGITHQTVGGFLTTGSSGGSVRFSMDDAIESIRFIDGLGRTHDVHRGEEMFDAVAVSMGLLGVITRVTFQCDPWFDVIGRETTSLTEDCEIDLFGDGPRGLREFLTATPYARLLWWPQPGVNKMTVWQARRMDRPDYLAQNSTPIHLKACPYEAIGMAWQVVADAIFSVLALRYGTSLLDRAIEAITPWVLPGILNMFVPTNDRDPTLFWDTWNNGLPMDSGSSDRLMATDFTELWIPIDRTREVMIALRDHYRANGLSAAGTYACEIYAAKRSPFFLSPAYDDDMIRVDIFWFANNIEKAKVGFYPQFWSLLKEFGFRPHWAKSLPPPDSEAGVDYLRGRYPQWDRFMALRDELDPHQVFVSKYWRHHLGIAAQREPRDSMVVPPGDAGEVQPALHSG
jgi:hypothetical protein